MIDRKSWLVLAVVGVAAGVAGASSVKAETPTASTRPAVCALVEDARTDALLSAPFRVVDGRIYLDARVNGEGPFTFAVDTGASGIGRADASLVARLGLPAAGSSETSDGVATARVDTVRLASLELGGLARRDVEVIARDYSSRMPPEAKIDGIIGRDFFANGLLVIDFPNRRLTFSRTARLASGEAGVLAYERPFRVPVTIGPVATEGQLDTGANVAFVLPKTLFENVGGATIAPAGDGRLTNTTVKTGSATLPGPIRIGAATLSGVEVRVSDTYPELLVGAHALRHFALLIDQRSSAVALCPPEPR